MGCISTGYITAIHRLPNTSLIVVACDTGRDSEQGGPWEIFDYQTRESVWKNIDTFPVNSRRLIPVDEETICSAHKTTLKCFNFQTQRTIVVPRTNSRTIDKLFFIAKNNFLTLSNSNKVFVERWNMEGTTIKRMWVLQVTENTTTRSSFLCSDGLMISTNDTTLQLVSFNGVVLKTIQIDSTDSARGNFTQYIDNRYLLIRTSYDVRVYDPQTQKSIVEFRLGNENYIHDSDMNSQHNMVVLATESRNLFVMRWREDISNDQARMWENLSKRQGKEFCDVVFL